MIAEPPPRRVAEVLGGSRPGTSEDVASDYCRDRGYRDKLTAVARVRPITLICRIEEETAEAGERPTNGAIAGNRAAPGVCHGAAWWGR